MRTGDFCAGYTYLTVLILVAITAGALAVVGELWHTASMREKEAELIYVGGQYRKAIERYYLSGQRQYPRELSDLVKDPRRATTERYLRRLYPDPITGSAQWGLVTAPDGGIMGVYSRSEGKPLKTGNFRSADQDFGGATRYSDWKFSFAVKVGGESGGRPAPGELAR